MSRCQRSVVSIKVELSTVVIASLTKVGNKGVLHRKWNCNNANCHCCAQPDTMVWWNDYRVMCWLCSSIPAMWVRWQCMGHSPVGALASCMVSNNDRNVNYGHPQSGQLWQNHFEQQLKRLGGIPLESLPSNFIFRRGGRDQHTLVLNIYVDDLTLAGGDRHIQAGFWDELKQLIEVGAEEFIGEKGVKILGRVHKIHRNPKIVEITYDMRSYARGIVEFYCVLTGSAKSKPRNTSTPCLPESNMTDAEVASEGTIQPFAARILMQCLWISRLARPDISFAVQRLASRVTRWTAWEDRQTLRLISYLNSTEEFVAKASGQMPEFLVYTDSDFASCPFTAKSTSGIVYILRTGSSCFPLLWSSKKQSSLGRSATVAELIASAGALFGEALNLHTMIESLAETRIPIKFQQGNQPAITLSVLVLPASWGMQDGFIA